jgi:leucyl-tRNA synthetase
MDKKPEVDVNKLSKEEKSARKKVYEALVKSKEVYEKTFAFNTLIAACMEALNELNKIDNKDIYTEGYWIITNILEPIVPHITNELADNLFSKNNFGKLEVDADALKEDEINMAVTINGKKRAEISISADASKEEILELAKQAIANQLDGKTIIKEIVVPKRLVNIVVKG